jgi:hypothetical protein
VSSSSSYCKTSSRDVVLLMMKSALHLSLLTLFLSPAACFLPSLPAVIQSYSSSSSLASTSQSETSTSMKWFQHEISITAPSRGCHLITSDVQKAIGQDLSQIKIGMCNLFIQHTSASLTINENADPDVRRYVKSNKWMVSLQILETDCISS